MTGFRSNAYFYLIASLPSSSSSSSVGLYHVITIANQEGFAMSELGIEKKGGGTR